MAENTYYVTLPNSGVTAEVTANSTRQARTVYLDYLTRSGVVPWRGRTGLRDQIIIDRIDSGQIPTDVQLSYGQVQETPEEDFELNGNGMQAAGSDYTESPYFDEEEDFEPERVSRPIYQNGASFGSAERQVRSEWDPQGSPEYAEDLPQPTRSGRLSSAGQGSSKIPSPADPGKLASAQTSSVPMPSPASRPAKLPGLAPGEKISMSPGGKVGGSQSIGGESKIGKLVKERFPRGKV